MKNLRRTLNIWNRMARSEQGANEDYQEGAQRRIKRIEMSQKDSRDRLQRELKRDTERSNGRGEKEIQRAMRWRN